MKHEMKTGSDHAESCSRRARARETRNVGSSKSAKVGGVSVLDVDTWEVLRGGYTVDEQSTHCRAVRSLRPCAAVVLLLHAAWAHNPPVVGSPDEHIGTGTQWQPDSLSRALPLLLQPQCRPAEPFDALDHGRCILNH